MKSLKKILMYCVDRNNDIWLFFICLICVVVCFTGWSDLKEYKKEILSLNELQKAYQTGFKAGYTTAIKEIEEQSFLDGEE